MNQLAVRETVKTVVRGVYFALLGVVALVLTVVASSPEVARTTVTLPVFDLPLSVGALIVTGAASLAKVIDRYVHKSDDIKASGIAPSFLQK